MDNNEEEKPKISKKIFIPLVILVIFGTYFGVSVVNPSLAIGWLWDMDIKQQLISANKIGLSHDPPIKIEVDGQPQELTLVKMRFVYANNDMTEERVQRAVEIFQELFTDPDNYHEIKHEDDTTIIEFSWKPEHKETSGILMPTT